VGVSLVVEDESDEEQVAHDRRRSYGHSALQTWNKIWGLVRNIQGASGGARRGS
jgi:hypothetical protein